MPGTKISIQDATRFYSDGKVMVFQDLTLPVYENEVLCIVGANAEFALFEMEITSATTSHTSTVR